MKSEIEERAVFVSFCIEQYAKAKNMPTEDVVNLFGKYELTEYLCEFYDELHTHGHNWLIEEIDEMIDSPTFPISESRESWLTLPSVGTDERANGEPSLLGLS